MATEPKSVSGEALDRELAELLEVETFEPSAEFREQALLSDPAVYEEAARDPQAWWAGQAKQLHWFEPWETVLDDSNPPFYKWFTGGRLNASYNCLDRHVLEGRGERVAIHWRGEEGQERDITYAQLLAEVQRFAGALKDLGVRRGDVVGIYLPMIPEVVVAMLACARIGAPHNVVFGGFSAEAVRERMEFSEAKVLITVDGAARKGKTAPVKDRVDEVMGDLETLEKIVVVRSKGTPCEMREGRDVFYDEILAAAAAECPAEPLDAEHPLFILYTSGSTGKPKGVLHTSGGYLVYASYTHELVFDLREDDVYWCTADVGWVTGHSYVVYGPLANGATTVMFDGVPNYPDFSRFWQVVDKHKVTLFYTAPTAIRALMREGEGPVKKASRASLRLLGTVGEPINPEAWEWYRRVVGDDRCPIVDTWWQTETGGILITPLPGAIDAKPGSATLPFFGINPAVVDAAGNQLDGPCEGNLIITDSWPGQMRTVYGDHQRFIETYFSAYPGSYFTGDGVRRDEDGYYWITGRVDDVINVAGHRIGTAEVESALVAHPKVAEAAVVGCPHEIKGQGIYAYVTLIASEQGSDELRKELIAWVRKEIGPIATPDYLQWAPGLPKTRSGKIMRRILRKIGENQPDQLGDISTLADPGVVKSLVDERLIK